MIYISWKYLNGHYTIKDWRLSRTTCTTSTVLCSHIHKFIIDKRARMYVLWSPSGRMSNPLIQMLARARTSAESGMQCCILGRWTEQVWIIRVLGKSSTATVPLVWSPGRGAKSPNSCSGLEGTHHRHKVDHWIDLARLQITLLAEHVVRLCAGDKT